jgi:hypothetical protein
MITFLGSASPEYREQYVQLQIDVKNGRLKESYVVRKRASVLFSLRYSLWEITHLSEGVGDFASFKRLGIEQRTKFLKII